MEKEVVLVGTLADREVLKKRVLVIVNEKNVAVIDSEIFGENVSAKFDAEREVKVANGLETLKSLLPEDLYLLAKYWENKGIRNSIKIDIEAKAAVVGLHPWEYITKEFLPKVQEMKEIGAAIERLSYATNYYKPRKDINVSRKLVTFQTKNEAGELIQISVYKHIVDALNEKYPNRKENKTEAKAFKKEILSNVVQPDECEEL
jgi:hypothetical protein